MKNETLILVYDGGSPICKYYATRVNIIKSFSDFQLINARDNHPIMIEIAQRGINIDQTSVLIIGDIFYVGAEASHKLALISSRSNLFNQINYWVFKSTFRAKILYPVFKCFRTILLKILGINKINL